MTEPDRTITISREQLRLIALAHEQQQKTKDVVDSREAAVVVDDLYKDYGDFTAVKGLSFTVKRGEIFALLGTNGAGKTTTIEILEGYRRLTKGQVSVLGLDPARDSAQLKQRIGLMLQQTALHDQMRVGEAIRLFCSYYKSHADPVELSVMVELDSHWKHPFVGLSGGQKQRLALALALAGNPELVFLDEPTAAMDPQARINTWGIIESLRQKGITMILTTHYMEEAQRLADRVAIIDRGELMVMGTPEELTLGAESEVVSFSGPPNLDLRPLERVEGAIQVSSPRPGSYIITTGNAIILVPELIVWMRQHNVEIQNLRVAGASLEDVFLQITGEEIRD